jgi:hypothetical protein
LLSVLFSGMPPGRPGQLIPSARVPKLCPFHDPTPATAGRLDAPGPILQHIPGKNADPAVIFSVPARITGQYTLPQQRTQHKGAG